MCGIAGVAARDHSAQPLAIDAVKHMVERMRKRGPDADGLWAGQGIVLGHRRLAILDLDSRSNQPMFSHDSRYAIVFNGEIYNYLTLRRELEANGATFGTTSDTEVLLELFARQGERMLPRLRGMFSFAVWDAHSHELFVARDPYGIKPLYYANTALGFVFASQARVVVQSGLISQNTESAGTAGFFLWGSVPEPWTLYRDVFSLRPGHWLRLRDGMMYEPVCWHDIGNHWRGAGVQLSAGELHEAVRDAVKDSVRAHLVADVPVSVFLSGGIDSATVAGLAAELGAQVEGITLGFDEFAGRQEDEVPLAADIAAHYALPHYVRRVTKQEFQIAVPRILAAMDQPSIDGVNTWFASKAAAERGYKVVLSGVGGDELFCGYSSFRNVPRTALLGRVLQRIPGAPALLAHGCRVLANSANKPKLAGLPLLSGTLEGAYFLNRSLFLPEELPELMGLEQAREGLVRLGGQPAGISSTGARDDISAIGLLESTQYLRNQLLCDSDWASMDHSLELRTPLVDAKLLETLGPYVSSFGIRGAGKSMLARTPAKPLPASVINKPKTGFAIPMKKWLSETLSHGSDGALSTPPAGTPWARQWARLVMRDVLQRG